MIESRTGFLLGRQLDFRVFAVAALLLLTGVVAIARAENSSRPMNGVFTLSDAAGRRVSSSDFAGKWLLIYFGYTHCSDLCPLGLTTMAAALDQLGPAAANIQPLMISVDPERDHGPMLKSFTEAFDKRLIGLTGSLEEIAKAAALVGVEFRKVQNGGEDYVVDHSATFTLIGPDRRTAETLRMGEAHLLAAHLIHVLGQAGVSLDRVGNVGAYR